VEVPAMNTAKRWSVELSAIEFEDATRAVARLVMNDSTCWLGHGVARRHPRDPDVTEIGEQIAVARALADLADLILGSTAAKLEDVTHEPVHLCR
jgi:Rv2632c-like